MDKLSARVVGRGVDWCQKSLNTDIIPVFADLEFQSINGSTELVTLVDVSSIDTANSWPKNKTYSLISNLVSSKKKTKCFIIIKNQVFLRTDMCQFDRLPKNIIDILSKMVKKKFTNKKSATFVSTSTYLVIVGLFLGKSWHNIHFKPLYKRLGSPTLYTHEDSFRQLVLVHDLAKSLLCLQGSKGFQHEMVRIRSIGKKDLQQAAGSLKIAMLFKSKFDFFEFVVPTGTRGLDYDLNVKSNSGHCLSIECKNKMQDTPYSDGIIKRDLKEARHQLRLSSHKKVITIQIPESWHHISSNRNPLSRDPSTLNLKVLDSLEAIVLKEINNHPQIFAVIIFWTEYCQFKASGGMLALKFKVFPTSKVDIDLEVILRDRSINYGAIPAQNQIPE